MRGRLAHFDRSGFAAADVAAELERHGTGPQPWSPDARLLLLIRRAMPSLRPTYRGVPLDRALLCHDDDADPRLVDLVPDLWRWRLLPELDGAMGADGFAEIDGLWRRLDVRWRAVATVLHADGGRLQQHLANLDPGDWRTDLLRAAADPQRVVQRSRDVAELQAELDGSPPGFAELVATVLPPPRKRKRAAGPDVDELVGLLMVSRVARAARVMAQVAWEEEDRVTAAATTRAVEWHQKEHWRLADRPVAMGWAAAFLGIAFVVLAGLLVVGDTLPPRVLPLATADALSAAWAYLVVGLAAQTACEVALAAVIGGRYHYDYSLFTLLLRAVAPVAQFGRRTFFAAAAVLAGAALAAAAVLPALLLAPYIVMAALLVAHVLSARRRYRAWRDVHDRERPPPVLEASSEGRPS